MRMLPTHRQLDHLELLRSGVPCKPLRGTSSASCFMALQRRGFAEAVIIGGTIHWRITEPGRELLLDFPPAESAGATVTVIGENGGSNG